MVGTTLVQFKYINNRNYYYDLIYNGIPKNATTVKVLTNGPSTSKLNYF